MLIVGADKPRVVENLPNRFLLIDDGPLIDALTFPPEWRVVELDLSVHSLNPLQGMDYFRACNFVSMIDAIFPEGQNTLTKKSANFELMVALTNPHRSKHIGHLIKPKKDNPGSIDAHQKLQRLLLSPVLKPFLTNPTNFPLDGIIIAKLDRSVLSDFDAFVIASVLMSAYQGHVVVPDFGFYGHNAHTTLVRDNRLTAGVFYLDEPKDEDLRQAILRMEMVPARCLYDDAVRMAKFEGLMPDPMRADNPFNEYVSRAVEGG